MDALLSVYLGFRKFFGALVPGIVWLVLLAILFPETRDSWAWTLRDVVPGSVLPYVVGLIAAYLVGNTATWFSFRMLEGFGEWLDRWAARKHSADVEQFLTWFGPRFHLLDRSGGHTQTLDATDKELHREFGGTEAPIGSPDMRWSQYKLFLREHAPSLATEDQEIEGEVNFTAGMVLPLAFAIAALLLMEKWWAVILLPVLAFLMLRFQHLKHYEGEFLAQANWAARTGQGK